MVLYICALDDIRCRCDLCGCERVSPYWDMATRWQGKRKCSMWTGLARLSDDLSLRIATTKRIFFSQIMKQINFSVGGGSVNPQRPPEEKEAMRNDNILRTGKTARDASYNGINGSLFKGYLCLSRGLWLLQCLCNWCRVCWCRIVDCGGCFFAKFNIESFNIV